MSKVDRRDVIEALTSAAVAFAWYAMPDVVRSPRVRGVAKVALMVPTAVVGVGVGQMRRAADAGAEAIRAARVEDGAEFESGGGAEEGLGESAGRAEPVDGSAVEGGTAVGSSGSADGARGGSPFVRRAALVGAGVVVLGGGVAATIAGERAFFRLGERLGERGVRWPHTRIGVAAALMAGGVSIATAPLAEPR